MTVALPPDLRRLRDRIRGWAEEYGLDFNETFFELLDHDALHEVAAYGGFPVRYPHWRFGMQYEELRKTYAYGLDLRGAGFPYNFLVPAAPRTYGGSVRVAF